MIDYLSGKLVEKTSTSIVVEVGGVAFRLSVSSKTLAHFNSIGEEVKIVTVLRLKEDDISLYGFADDDERVIFKLLLSVSGIGPKLAISILSGISPAEFVDLVLSGSTERLTKFPGIGKRTAERVMVELKDKIPLLDVKSSKVQKDLSTSQEEGSTGSKVRARTDAFSALTALGYTRVASEKALRLALQEDGDADTQTLIKLALRHITA